MPQGKPLPPWDPTAIAEVRRAIPNLGSVSVEQGIEILRAAALKDFRAAAQEQEGRIREAQAGLARAERSGAPSEEEATARQRLRQVQAVEAERLQQIAGRLQARIAALRQLKQQ